jgi:hypothetical protein
VSTQALLQRQLLMLSAQQLLPVVWVGPWGSTSENGAQHMQQPLKCARWNACVDNTL